MKLHPSLENLATLAESEMGKKNYPLFEKLMIGRIRKHVYGGIFVERGCERCKKIVDNYLAFEEYAEAEPEAEDF